MVMAGFARWVDDNFNEDELVVISRLDKIRRSGILSLGDFVND